MSDASGEVDGPVFEGWLSEDAEAAGELLDGPLFEGRLEE